MGEPAVLLISHGSRQPHAAVLTRELAAALRQDEPARAVGVSFLELQEPTPADALRQLARDGHTDIAVVPLLFSAGYHYRIDVPAALDAVLDSVPDMRVQVAPALLNDSPADLIDALDTRLDEAIAEAAIRTGSTHVACRPDGLVLLAAGSSDALARARIRELAESWGHSHGLPTQAAFCDLTGSEVRAAVARLTADGARRIACGALFLAAGRLLDTAREAALVAGAQMVAAPLGLTPALLRLIRQRCRQPVTAG